MAAINYQTINAYFDDLQQKHVDLKSFFRFDLSEIMGKMRNGVEYPALLLEDTALSLADNGAQNKSESFEVSFLVLKTSKPKEYDLTELALADCLEIAKEIERRLQADAENPSHWLYNRYDQSQTNFHKVGPIFADTCWGYRCSIILTNTDVQRLPTAAKWSDL
tara:strand:- start:29015 stop:29506 length:492 start_codon:yes stop_codon:yes gene_type:complete